jgi:uncharacterized protein (TIGR03435 family)
MPDRSDTDLLRDYSEHSSETAFAELVRRHIGLVYSAALRHAGTAAHAEEITQAVFVILAQKAHRLRRGVVLEGWLHETTRFTALTFLRAERRRQFREQEAYMQSTLPESNDAAWEQLAPLLDEGLSRLGPKDRDAVVLRFLKDKSVREVAAALDLNEPAAQRRILRAVEKLRLYFNKRGVVLPAVVFTAAISANSVQAAPAALAQTVTAGALAGSIASSGSTSILIQGALKIMAWSKAKTAVVAIAGILLAAGTATVAIERHHERKAEKLWRINKTVATAQIDKLPAMVRVLPTKFDPPWVNWNSGANGDKFIGARARAGIIAAYAYGFPQGRIRFPTGEPTNRFDFVATLPQGSSEALQRELKRKLGLVGRREMETVDVLLLKARYPNAPGFKPAIPAKNDQYSKSGVYHDSNGIIDTGAPRFSGLAHYLESYFKMPVIDQTGITQRFGMHLTWKEKSEERNPDGLKQVLLTQLGLELTPARMPVEFLIMEER